MWKKPWKYARRYGRGGARGGLSGAGKKYVRRAIKAHDLKDRVAFLNITCQELTTNVPDDCPGQATIDITTPFVAKEQRVSLRGGKLFLKPLFTHFKNVGPVRIRCAVIRQRNTDATLAPIPKLFDPNSDNDYTDAHWMRFPQEKIWWPEQRATLLGIRPTCPTRAIGNLGPDGAPIPCEDLEWCEDPDNPCGDVDSLCTNDNTAQVDYSISIPRPLEFSLSSLMGRRELHLKEYEQLILVTAWVQSSAICGQDPVPMPALEIAGSGVIVYHGDAE